MKAENVVQELSEILKDYLDDDTNGATITDDTRPLQDIKGFESDFIPEVVRRLAREVYKKPLPKGTRVKNIFVEKGRKLTVKEIAEKFQSNYAPKEVKA